MLDEAVKISVDGTRKAGLRSAERPANSLGVWKEASGGRSTMAKTSSFVHRITPFLDSDRLCKGLV